MSAARPGLSVAVVMRRERVVGPMGRWQPWRWVLDQVLPQVTGHDPQTSIVTTLAQEKTFNTFFRLTSPGVITKLREAFPDLPEKPDRRTVFLKLRELRNTW